jgi:SET family sugar efflux transporter-like MFS transporter
MRRVLIPTAALVGGLQLALLNPVIALLLSALYGATPGQVGLVLAIMNASGFVAAIVLPAWADRRREYLVPMFVCGVLTLATAVLLAVVTSLTAAAVVLVVLAGPAGVWSGLLFAHQRHRGDSSEQVIRTRAMFSVAWVAGPPLATGAMTGFGDHSVLLLIAVVAAASLGLNLLLQRQQRADRTRGKERSAADAEDAGGPDGGSGAGTPSGSVLSVSKVELVAVVVAITGLQAANAGAVTTTPLLVTDRLELPTVWAGIALGLCAALEIPALLGVGRLTRYLNSTTLLVAGAFIGVLYYGLVPLASSPVLLLALQIPNALTIATLSGVGLTWFQEAIDLPGAASGIYLNARRVGSILIGPVLATAALSPLGYAIPFWVFAALSLAAALLIGGIGLRGHRAGQAGPEESRDAA